MKARAVGRGHSSAAERARWRCRCGRRGPCARRLRACDQLRGVSLFHRIGLCAVGYHRERRLFRVRPRFGAQALRLGQPGAVGCGFRPVPLLAGFRSSLRQHAAGHGGGCAAHAGGRRRAKGACAQGGFQRIAQKRRRCAVDAPPKARCARRRSSAFKVRFVRGRLH